MKIFDYTELPKALLTPEIVSIISKLHEHKGKQELYIDAHIDELNSLLEIAKIQSTEASNKIEGIKTTDKRLSEIVKQKSNPRNRTEQEIAGYRDVLTTIHESYDYIKPTPNVLLQLHKQLYSFSQNGVGGNFKNSDNYISEVDDNGKEFIRFQTVPAYLTPTFVDTLFTEFQKAIEKSEYDALLLIPLYILDFLCIHPFNDGNGRMSRLLTLLLLYRSGYIVGKYVSIEKLIEKSKETYYEVLQDSSIGWHENKNDYSPFIKYFLAILQKAYNEFEERLEYLSANGLSKPERIKKFIDKKIGQFAKRDILEAFPDISKVTVERTLTSLSKQGYIVKTGAGPTTNYIKSPD